MTLKSAAVDKFYESGPIRRFRIIRKCGVYIKGRPGHLEPPDDEGVGGDDGGVGKARTHQAQGRSHGLTAWVDVYDKKNFGFSPRCCGDLV